MTEIEKLEEALEIHNPECVVERRVHEAARAHLEQLKTGGWNFNMDEAPSYEFLDDSPTDYLAITRGCETGRELCVIGHFKEDGFYLSDGGELSHAFDLIAWKPLDLPTTPNEMEG